VRLEGGGEIAADLVVSNADPKATLLKLLGARHLETELTRRVHNLRMQGSAAKLHLALSELPEFRGVPGDQLGERLIIAPDLDYIERAFNPAKYREYSAAPVMEITIPSIHDPDLAPAGRHVLSAVIQYAPYDLAAGWDGERDRFREVVLDVLERFAPGLRRLVVGAELLTPLDIERQFRISGGHWHHGELALDQFMMLRPVPGAAQYAMPVRGLYLCGAGCHPGGGVMGTAGRNAASAVLKGQRA
jgi:phytoene dehydrogenase-like protein